MVYTSRPDLIMDYRKFCEYRAKCKKSGRLDLSGETFFFPTTLLPLMTFIIDEKVPVILPEDPNVTSYIVTVTNGSRFGLAQRFKKSYIPLVSLPRDREEANKILQRIYEMHNNGRDCGGENAFKYLIGEIVDNIYEHSEFDTSWVMAQAYGSMRFMDICFFDDGITINGCFKKHGMGFESDCQAIVEAINGASTKGDQRGFGLNTTMRIFTHGIKGQMLIVSGKGCVMFSKTKKRLYSLSKTYELGGTLVSVRIPYPSPEVNIYEYL